ncbi:MAG: adenylosuccinate lyase [Runella slithyformis]|nr:MAG: adenylosuccinate lyase [Runella slithyformis]TAF22924.1 MAG: adenylosuccinate lyase [Runella slithyformis]TAF49184.1 MAG: adenylosuccinate lyase [Runella slithyformis]TAF78504.1 MAG: adenylosuccinate lyase [Runella slithyformis]TAH16770.1 MAG: adenylosuccinate lyase [Runella slithyformis]
MELNSLTAVSPIDGRYRKQVEPLAPYFSELGLIRYRIRIEVEYFIALCELPLPQLSGFDKSLYDQLRDLYQNFTETDALRVKAIEATTNHDVKAVEYFIKEKLKDQRLEAFLEFIHFGLTSQDINNTSIPLLLKEALHEQVVPLFGRVVAHLQLLADQWKGIPMLARTHGQPASPTRLGKEILVFVERLEKQLAMLQQVPFAAKFGGATGNFNAHHVAYPAINWPDFGNYFVNHVLGLSRSQVTTQIEHYDMLAATFDNLKRLNTILIDFDRDLWTYISMEYFKQKIKAGEVGSSAMPHKVNPIDFENSEGNLGMANAIFEYLSAKLPISRLQRDLTDSTVLRNVGVPLAHTMVGLRSLLRGLEKLELNEAAIKNDLENNWAVVAEAIQTVLRREAYPEPYEALKALTRKNQKITATAIAEFIETLAVSEAVKMELRAINPFSYVGV